MKKKTEKLFFKKNTQIKTEQVRVVNDEIEPGVYETFEAIEKAKELDLDLIQVSEKSNPPICKLMAYDKFLYQQKKKQKELEKKKRDSQVEVKEIRFTPYTDEHDFNFKLNHISSFLKKGNRVKAYVVFKGRDIKFKENGEKILLRLVDEVSEIGKIEAMPKMEGKRMTVFVFPKK